jgi:predicted transposase/invertase (TIGR01784 family)
MTKPTDLLDPKNDYVFFRLFSEEPELLIDLINAVRVKDHPIAKVRLFNPLRNRAALSNDDLMLDLDARDARGHDCHVEVRMRRQAFENMPDDSMYLNEMIHRQLDTGATEETLKPVYAVHLLDFDKFEGAKYQNKALWCFEMVDKNTSERLEDALQMNLVELPKAARLRDLPERLSAWVDFFMLWDQAAVMNDWPDSPIQKALRKLRALSADDDVRHEAGSRAQQSE